MINDASPHRKYEMPSTADSREQVAAVRALVASQRHAATMAATSPRPAPSLMVQRCLYQESELNERKVWATRLTGDAKKTVDAHLEIAEALGPFRQVALAPHPSALIALDRDFPHFSEVTAYIRRSVSLCRVGGAGPLRVRPTMVSGSPGIGKTAYFEALARTLGIPHKRVDVGGLSAGFSLGGLDVSYTNAKPGLVWETLQAASMSALVSLDEIDKLTANDSRSHLAPLYSLLERVSNQRFTDGAIGLPIDTSYINWFATCNEVNDIEPALASRFEVFNVQNPNLAEMKAVIHSINKVTLDDADWGEHFDTDLDEAVIARLSLNSPREVGRLLEEAYATAAAAGRRQILAGDVPARRGRAKQVMGFFG